MNPTEQDDLREAGFTLVELLVGITLMLIVLAAAFTLLQIVVRSEPADPRGEHLDPGCPDHRRADGP